LKVELNSSTVVAGYHQWCLQLSCWFKKVLAGQSFSNFVHFNQPHSHAVCVCELVLPSDCINRVNLSDTRDVDW